MAGDLSETLLRQLNPAQVRWYAVRAGWTPVNGSKRPVIVLNHPTDGLTQIQIPTAGAEREVAFLMGEAVQALAKFERRQAREVLADLAVPPADILRLHIQSPSANSGTLPLDEGLNLLKGGSSLLLAAACSAHQPLAHYRSQTFAPAQEFLRSCQLGQTERGSYIATIIAPVTPELTPSLFDAVGDDLEIGDEPYERRVTLLLMQALQVLRGTLDRGRADELLRAVPQGVSANLCDALASMSPSDSRASLQVSMAWSRNRPRVPSEVPARIGFAQAEFSTLREAGRRLRNVEPRRVQVKGPVIGLQAEPADLVEDFRGNVTIRTLVSGRSARVRFVLQQSEYQQACDAHRDRRRVAISGLLHGDSQTRVFDLDSPKEFRVLGAEAATADPSDAD